MTLLGGLGHWASSKGVKGPKTIMLIQKLVLTSVFYFLNRLKSKYLIPLMLPVLRFTLLPLAPHLFASPPERVGLPTWR